MLSNTSRCIDLAGLDLAAATGRRPRSTAWRCRASRLLAGTIAAIAFLVGFVRAALRGQDKLAAVNGLLSGIVGLLILLAYGPWTWGPPGSGALSPGRRRHWPGTRCCGPGLCRRGRHADPLWAGSVPVRT